MENINDCCPPFNPSKWDGKEIKWDKKRFVKAKVRTFFYMPLNFGSVIKRIQKKVDDSKAVIEDYLCLSDHTSKWSMDILLAVDKKVDNIENVLLSGTFYSKVYEGPFQDTGKWCKDFERDANFKNLNIKKWYMWYTTCPKCAKKSCKNYVAVIAEVDTK